MPSDSRTPCSRIARIVLFAACAVVLPACMSQGPGSAAQAERKARAEDVVRRGYQPIEHAAIESGVLPWRVDGERVPIAWTVPAGGNALPVVVYLPGLGESAESAGALWRRAWTQAGYAVVSIQPLDDDATAWNSEEARSLEFKALAAQRHSAARLEQRIGRLAAALREMRRRAAAGEAPWHRLDYARMAVTGYDLGAQTAMALAGQHEPGGPIDELTGRLRAVIVLSPVVLQGEAQRTRFERMTGPVLSVTGPSDVDPTGLVPTGSRTIAFDLMPAGEKFELELRAVSHAMLSGAIEADRGAQREERANGRAAGPRGGRSRQRSDSSDIDRDASEGNARPGSERAHAREQLPASAGKEECDAAIQVVSVAFLDASLRRQPAAERWLDEQVPQWLQQLGTWRKR
jgi:dienelactone hydrolase